MKNSDVSILSYLDIVILRRIKDAEDRHSSVPPAFVDALVRLSKVGCIRIHPDRAIRITTIGRQFLQTDDKASVLARV